MSNHNNLFEFDSAPSEFESNLSHFKNHNHVHEEDLSASMPMITLYIANLILLTLIGCPLYLAIIHYERFGCDPQKRSLLNMIFANQCIFQMVGILTLNLFLGIRILMGPLHLRLADPCLATIIFMSSCVNLSTITLLVFGNLQLLKPQIVSSLNDEFWYIIITLVTLLLNFWPAAHFFYAENDQKWHILDYLLTGQEKRSNSRIYLPPFFMLSFLFINVFVYFFLKFCKILKLESTSENQSIGQQFNTLKRNPKVFKHIWLLVVFLIDATVVMLALWLLKDVPQPFDTSLGGALLLSICFGFFTPIALWSSNPKLISYTIREFWDIAPMWLINLRETIHQPYPRSHSIELQPTENARPDDPDPPIFVCHNEFEEMNNVNSGEITLGQ